MELAFEDMTVDQRLRHVQELWDRIAEEPAHVPVPDAMVEELDRRMTDHLANPARVVSWTVLKDGGRTIK